MICRLVESLINRRCFTGAATNLPSGDHLHVFKLLPDDWGYTSEKSIRKYNNSLPNVCLKKEAGNQNTPKCYVYHQQIFHYLRKKMNYVSSGYSKPTQQDDDYFVTITDPNDDESAILAGYFKSLIHFTKTRLHFSITKSHLKPILRPTNFLHETTSLLRIQTKSRLRAHSSFTYRYPEIVTVYFSTYIPTTHTHSLTDVQVTELLIKLSRPLCSDVVACTASDLFQDAEIKIEKLCFGCPIIDKHFRGGVLSRGITEIVGEAGRNINPTNSN
jgi:hypothetical protein